MENKKDKLNISLDDMTTLVIITTNFNSPIILKLLAHMPKETKKIALIILNRLKSKLDLQRISIIEDIDMDKNIQEAAKLWYPCILGRLAERGRLVEIS